MNALAKLTTVETKLLLREPGSLVSVLIPLFFLVVFGASADGTDTILLPMGTAIAVALIGLYLLPTTLAGYRERGVLKRLATTPVKPGNLLAVQLLLQLVLLAASTALQLTVADRLLGLALPSRFGVAALVLALGTAAMFAIGLLIAALAPNGRAANGIGVLLYFPWPTSPDSSSRCTRCLLAWPGSASTPRSGRSGRPWNRRGRARSRTPCR
nr:hypothetical protein GCM10025732_11410 [Glycomyces mayteni]